MNCREHPLPELELATNQVREALQCLLHTILFIRAPGPVVPQDVHCEGFDLTYTRIAGTGADTSMSANSSSHSTKSASNTSGNNSKNIHRNNSSASLSGNDKRNVDQKVNDAIEVFLRSLTHVGPELLQGSLTISFFERRATQKLFWTHEEKVV